MFSWFQIIEQEAQKMISESKSTSGDDSSQNEEDDKDVPMAELEDDIPLTKTGYPVPPAYPPIQASLMKKWIVLLHECLDSGTSWM